ncbi:hypothetical protein [Actinotalea sp. C106]|uniref:hypothetical protein n=1 Tax=Actinotalea sp. C106 TaxID=2908644 RepID=UPI002027B6A1|nr:hypothetical protein [Actinotalea sp. C106]
MAVSADELQRVEGRVATGADTLRGGISDTQPGVSGAGSSEVLALVALHREEARTMVAVLEGAVEKLQQTRATYSETDTSVWTRLLDLEQGQVTASAHRMSVA